MWSTRILLNVTFNILALLLIVKILIIDNPDLSKISFIFSYKAFLIFIFFMLLKLLITLLFYFIINTVSDKKYNYISTSGTYLQGGIINQLIPGLGFIFRYYKFKDEANVSLAQFSISQSIWSMSAFSSYLIVGAILGLIIFSANIYNILFLGLGSILTLFFTYIFRSNIYKFIINNFGRFSKFINDLKDIKNILKKKYYIFFFIFTGFIILTCLETLGFFSLLIIFGSNVSLFDASTIWVGSTLVRIITMINFFGLFELILTTTSSLLLSNFKEMFIFAVGFRIINTLSLLSVIALIFIIKLIQQKLS